MIGEIGRFIEGKVCYFGESEKVDEIKKIGFEIEKVEDLSKLPEDCRTLIFLGESIRDEKINEIINALKDKNIKFLIIYGNVRETYAELLKSKLGMDIVSRREDFIVLAKTPGDFKQRVLLKL